MDVNTNKEFKYDLKEDLNLKLNYSKYDYGLKNYILELKYYLIENLYVPIEYFYRGYSDYKVLMGKYLLNEIELDEDDAFKYNILTGYFEKGNEDMINWHLGLHKNEFFNYVAFIEKYLSDLIFKGSNLLEFTYVGGDTQMFMSGYDGDVSINFKHLIDEEERLLLFAFYNFVGK